VRVIVVHLGRVLDTKHSPREPRVDGGVSGGAKPNGGRSEAASVREHVIDEDALRQRIQQRAGPRATW
jgi:hypothetical protein